MAVRITCVLVVAFALSATALDSLDNAGIRVAVRVFDECTSKAEGLSPCLKKKALTFLDRLGRMDKLAITDEIVIVKAPQAPVNATPLTEDVIDKTLPRSFQDRDQALSTMLWDKVASVIRSKNVEFTMPRMSDMVEYEEGRDGKIKIPKIKGGKKGGGLMMGMMMAMMGKMMGLIPIGIAGLFLLAGKALITSKIALLLSGIIALKKLVAAKHEHGHGHGHGGGGHHVYASSGGGGWDRRSLDETQKLAYSAHTPK